MLTKAISTSPRTPPHLRFRSPPPCGFSPSPLSLSPPDLPPMSSSHHPPIFLFLLLFLLSSAAAGASTDPSQCASLLDLRRSFTNSSGLATWRPGTDCCAWDGVTCDPQSGLVTGLDFSNRSIIAGKISTSLFNLTSLRTLNLAYNVFGQNPIPDEIELLANLTNLNLSNAGFIGQIPIGVAKLTNLVSLDLSSLSFNERLQSHLQLTNPNFETLIGNLSNLRELYLDGVNISANGYQWCAAVGTSTPKLKVLSLSTCLITGPIDSSLAELRYLSVLRLGQNELNSSVPEFFGKFSSLREIWLSFCGLHGDFPKNVLNLKNLTVVDLAGNWMLSGSLPEFIDGSNLKSLLLSSTNFSGHLPNSIGKLKSLTTMDLSDCQFSGVVPSSIGNLTWLVQLDLSLNKFTGPIPSTFGNLKHLRKLDLSKNMLSWQIPASLFALPALQELRLNLNQLSGQLQEFSNGSPRLGVVDMSNNRLQGDIPRSVFQLPGLKTLSLASNNFSGTVELDRFSALRNLASLDLSYSGISVQDNGGNDSVSFPKFGTLMLASCNLTLVPTFLRYQDKMSKLDLSNNNIHGAIPNWIWSIGNKSLNYLNLSCNSFTSVEGPLPDLHMNVTMNLDLHSNFLQGSIPLPPLNTVILDYSNNYFSSSIPSNISSYLSFTAFFSVANNSLTGEIPPSICKASNLLVLDFSDNMLSGQIPPCLFEGGSNLGVLNFRRNQFQGTIPGIISERCGLRTINLNCNHLEGQIPRALANCSELEVLDLGNNRINGSFPFWLGNISSLRVLVLRSNELYGPVGPSPRMYSSNNTFPMLQLFDISSNHFNGTLPVDCFKNLKALARPALNPSPLEFEYLKLHPSFYQNTVTVTSKGMVMTLARILTIFTSLDFSNNFFEGNIPDVIAELLSLNVLNFSHNSLTGNIPQSIGNLRQLESLDLSENHLTGEIPPTLSNLTFLSSLNLSNNYLVGRIPQGFQLSTFPNTSFERNKGLCGIPLTKQCDNSSAQPSLEPNLQAFKSVTEVNWQFVFIGLGFGGGLAVVVGTLMLWETGRRWYNEKVDSVLQAIILSAFSQLCDYLGDRRVGAEEEMDGNSKEMDEWHGRRFCLFCTKLEFCQGRVRIHHVECDCPLERD